MAIRTFEQPAPPATTQKRSSIGARRSPQAEAAILAAAEAVLSERGYAGFSIDEVARRACAGKPTIYRWWPTKALLLLAVYEAQKDRVVSPPDTGALKSDLIKFTRDVWRFWRGDAAGRAFRALIAEAQSSPVALEALRDGYMAERMKILRAIFDRAAQRGEIDAARAPILAELFAGFWWFRLLNDRIDDDAAIEAMAEALTH